MLLETLTKDIRHGFRILVRAPGFAVAAVVSLAIGIGANTAMFSVVYGVLLRPLPYPEAERLVTLWSENRRLGISKQTSAYSNVDDWRKSARTLDGVAIYDPVSIILTSGEARRVSALLCSSNFMQMLRVQPQLGRMFTENEVERRAPVAVLSHSAWKNYHGGTADILGRGIEIDGRRVEIVGVMPKGFQFDDSYLLMPVSLARDWNESRQNRGVGPWRAIARLSPGITAEQAQTELTTVAAGLARTFPENVDLGVRLIPLAEHIVGRELRTALVILLAAVGAVLLIACSNVGNLLLARGLTRQREFAVRLSLGATRGRIVMQLLVENLVLCLLAAAAGSVLAWFAVDAVRVFGPPNTPRLDEVTLDWRMLVFAVALSLASACLFGLLPALKSTRRDSLEILQGGARGTTEAPRNRRLRGALVVAEFALAVILFAGAGMLLRSFAHLLAVDPGFKVDGVLLVGMRLPANRAERDSVPYATTVVERVAALPGVAAAAVSEEVMLGERAEQTLFVEGATPDQVAAARMSLGSDAVTPDFFKAMGVALHRGRFFTLLDGPDAPPVVIINETLAKRLWPGEVAIGRRLRSGGPNSTEPWATVVGIAADQRRQGLDRSPIPQAFWPLAQRPSRGLILIVRTQVEPASLSASVRRVVQSVDSTVPVGSGTTLRTELDRTLAPRQFHTGLLSIFAAIALVLAGVGIFGLMHYSVVRRTHEIGVRTALGASAPQILQQVLGEGLKLAGLGVALGLAGAVALLRVFSSLLFEVSPTDPVSLGVAAAVLVAIAALACFLPALRASRIDPMAALRVE